MNKKKLAISFSLLALFLILIFSNSILTRAAQDDSDLEVTLHCRLDSNSAEIQSTLISPGTYTFFDEPLLDTGEFSHDLTQIEVERLQTQTFNYTDSENYQFVQPTNATQGNHTVEFPNSINAYTIAKELDTVIAVNMNYSAINYSSSVSNFNDELDPEDWNLYDEYDNSISLIDGNYNATYSFDNQSWHSNFHRTIYGSSEITYEPLIDDHITCVQLDDQDTGDSSDLKIDIDPISSGSVELWVRTTDANKGNYVIFHDNVNPPDGPNLGDCLFALTIDNGQMYYWAGSWVSVMSGIQSSQWYHWRIDLECSSDTFDWYVDSVLKASDVSFRKVTDAIRDLEIDTYDPDINFQFQVDGLGITGQDDDYQVGMNIDPIGVAYARTGGSKELYLYNSKGSDVKVTSGDTLEISGYVNTSESFNVKFLKDDVEVHEQEIMDDDDTDFINLSITDTFEFDQLCFQGIFENERYFIFEGLNIRGYPNDPLFDNVYIVNFTYQLLGINYTESFECELDQIISEYSTPNGMYRYYIDSSMFSQFDRNNDLTILAQEITVIFDLSSSTGFLFTMNISWSENDWILPTQCDLTINSNEVIDTSLNSGVVYLSTFPETLVITSDISSIVFQLNISISFTLTFDLEIITKTYLRKSFTLLSDHDIVIEKIDLPDNLDLKKVYFNDNSIGTTDPNVLNPEQTMTSGNIYTLEIILDDAIHERLPYINNLATNTYEYLYREKFTYVTSEMTHSYSPDSQNQTYKFSNGYLEMSNSFPNEYHEEGWSGWNNDYNSSYIESTESNGNFSSRLNNYSSSSLPDQPDDFTFTNGSFNSTDYGDLNEIDEDYSILNSTAYVAGGTYPATYSFTNDVIGGNPTGWTVSEPAGTDVRVNASLDDHDKVLEIHDGSGSATAAAYVNFAAQSSGTYEFWWRLDATATNYHYLISSGTGVFWLQGDASGNLKYYDDDWHTIGTYSTDTWYHFRIEFDMADDWHLWIDEVQQDNELSSTDFDFITGAGATVDRVHWETASSAVENLYLDALGFSWDPSYNIGDNLNPLSVSSPALNVNITFDFDTSIIHANETLDHVQLEYSLNTSLTDIYVNVSIWNFDLGRFIVLNFSQNDGNFYDIVHALNSSLYNASYHVILNFNASNEAFFRLYLDKLLISYNWTKTSGLIYSNFSKFIDYSFLNRYDAFSTYQKLYNVTVSFQYRFSNYTSYSYHANITINDNSTVHDLTIDGSWNEYSLDFTFNSSIESGFWITLNLTNGLLEIIEMNYSITFNCLDVDGKTRLLQYFKIEPTFTLDEYEKEMGRLYINFTHYFSHGDDSFHYANNSQLTIKLNIQSEDSILTNYYYYNLSFTPTLFSLNIRSLLNNNSKEQFLDFSLEFWLSGDEAEYHLDNLYLLNDLQRIQLTTNPRTDEDSVEFRDFLVASRDFSYWYFYNTYDINSVDMLNKRTSSLTESFDENNSRYYFIDSAQDDDIYQSDLDYDPNWDVSYEVIENTGVYSRIKVTYKADMAISNVTIVLDLSDDNVYNSEWTKNATQGKNTMILEIPNREFTSSYQSFYIEGVSDTPFAEIREIESDQNWNRLAEDTEIDFAAYLKYPKYSQTYLLDVNESWICYDVYYADESYSIKSISDTRIYFKGRGFDSSVKDSYLHFRATPFTTADWNYNENTNIITITIVSTLDVEKVSFEYYFDPSGVHDLELMNATNDFTLYNLTDSEKLGYLTFHSYEIHEGTTIITIHVNFSTPLEIFMNSIIIFIVGGGFIGAYYYLQKNEEVTQKIKKFVGPKIDKIEQKFGKGDSDDLVIKKTKNEIRIEFKGKGE